MKLTVVVGVLVATLPGGVAAQAPGAGRILDCTPETTTAGRGSSRSVTCAVTDASGNPVQGVDVSFAEMGPAAITSSGTTPAPDNDAPDGQEYRTDSFGRVTIVVSTVTGDSFGSSTVTGQITGEASGAPSATTECAREVDDPAGAPAGTCEDAVTITWQTDAPPPTLCHDGIDNDGDGYIDYPSDPTCESFEGVSEMVDDHSSVGTNVTIRYRPRLRRWEGAIGSPIARCQRGRTVLLKRALRDHRDPVAGADLSDRNGIWRITKGHRAGRYYAIARYKEFTNAAGDTVRCARDRSVTIRIG